MKIDSIIEVLKSCIANSEGTELLDDFLYAAFLSDDELDDVFYECLMNFIKCFLVYICTPNFNKLSTNDILIIQRFFVVSVFRFKRGLVSFPDTKEDEFL